MKDIQNENIVHIKKDNVEYVQFKRLLEYQDKINHCYTMKVGDKNFKNVNNQDYKELYKELNLNYDKLVDIKKQIHSDKIEIVDDVNKEYTNVDGLLTNIKGVSLVLKFADCTTIYLYDFKKNVIGNIHSGWKGTAQKIGQKAIKKMIEYYNSDPKDIICCLGPCIQKCHFKVDEDVKDIFQDTFSYFNQNSKIITKGEIEEDRQKYYIDTTLINRLMLEEVGIKKENIIESKICTVCNSTQFHSYRKDRENSGRNAGIIALV